MDHREAVDKCLVDIVRTESDGSAVPLDIALAPYIMTVLTDHINSRALNAELDQHPIRLSAESVSDVEKHLSPNHNTVIHQQNERLAIWTRIMKSDDSNGRTRGRKRKGTHRKQAERTKLKTRGICEFLSQESEPRNEEHQAQWQPTEEANDESSHVRTNRNVRVNLNTQGPARWAGPCGETVKVGQLTGARTLVKAKAYRHNDKIP